MREYFPLKHDRKVFANANKNFSFKQHTPIVFRSVDMATPLHHTWTYQALAHDVLPYHQNRLGTNIALFILRNQNYNLINKYSKKEILKFLSFNE